MKSIALSLAVFVIIGIVIAPELLAIAAGVAKAMRLIG